MEFDDVRMFHRKFDQLDPGHVTHLTKRKLAERINFMLEELLEFAQASDLLLYAEHVEVGGAIDDDQDMELQADALVDLAYVCLGTAAMMGLPWSDLWDDVQRANMAKVKGPTHRNMGFGSDICKPPGWVGPMTGAVLRAHGYDRMAFEDDDGRVDDRKCLDDEGAPR